MKILAIVFSENIRDSLDLILNILRLLSLESES